MTTTATRIYIVSDEHGSRLVRASNRSQALRHVAQDSFNVSVATQDELVMLLGDGVEVETISADPETLPLDI